MSVPRCRRKSGVVTVIKRGGEEDQADDDIACEHPAERVWPDTEAKGRSIREGQERMFGRTRTDFFRPVTGVDPCRHGRIM